MVRRVTSVTEGRVAKLTPISDHAVMSQRLEGASMHDAKPLMVTPGCGAAIRWGTINNATDYQNTWDSIAAPTSSDPYTPRRIDTCLSQTASP